MPRGNIKMTYYLQYGTAVTDRTLERRVQSARLEGQGLLKGWRMDFSREGGQPNLVQDPAGQVWGLLYLVEEQHLSQIDAIENGGTRVEGTCLFEWEPEACVFYTFEPKQDQPGAEYLKNLREFYRQAGLPQAQIDGALKIAATK